MCSGRAFSIIHQATHFIVILHPERLEQSLSAPILSITAPCLRPFSKIWLLLQAPSSRLKHRARMYYAKRHNHRGAKQAWAESGAEAVVLKGALVVCSSSTNVTNSLVPFSVIKKLTWAFNYRGSRQWCIKTRLECIYSALENYHP